MDSSIMNLFIKNPVTQKLVSEVQCVTGFVCHIRSLAQKRNNDTATMSAQVFQLSEYILRLLPVGFLRRAR